MSILLKYLSILLILTLTSIQAIADESSLLEEYMDISGLNEQLGSISTQMSSGLAQGSQQNPDIDQQTLTKLQSTANKVFSTGDIALKTHDLLKNKLPKKSWEHQLQWYRSDLGKKITSTEVTATKSENFEAIEQAINSIPDNTKRVEKLKKLDQLISGIDRSADSMIIMQVAIMSAFADMSGNNYDTTIEAIKASKNNLKSQLETYSYGYYLYTYQGITDEELDKYLSFLENADSQRVIQLVSTSIDAVLNEKYKEFGISLAQGIVEPTPPINNGVQSGRYDAPTPPR